MILPDNGKVVIIDDKIGEVEALMAGLSAEKVPFVYYQKVDGTDLPSEPIENVRLVFLDLLLIDETKGQAASKVLGPVASRLTKILSKDNGPYVLIYWSVNEAEYKDEFEKQLDGTLKDYKPLLRLSLDKSYSGDMKVIKDNLNKLFDEKFGALNAFLFWESIVNKSGGDVVNEFAGFDLLGATKDESLKNILYKLAKAVDEQGVDSLDDEEKVKKAFNPVNQVLLDLLYANIANCKWPKISDIKIFGAGGDDKYTASINARLHLKALVTEQDKKSLASGNIYVIPITDENKARLDKILAEMLKTNIEKENPDSPVFIMLDVSPPCDYAQNNLQRIRLLPGVLFEHPTGKVVTCKNKDSGYNQLSSFCLNDKIQGMFFDFRYLRSETVDDFKNRALEATYRIGMEMLADIQAKLARHINRPGIVSIK